MARASTGARLHFGFCNLSLSHERLYGALGLALAEPRVTVEAVPAESVTVAVEADALADVPETEGQAQSWWSDVVGPGKAIDTNEYYVVCVNDPGSCYGTTGPASANPETGEPYGTDFPPVTVGDWTRVQR